MRTWMGAAVLAAAVGCGGGAPMNSSGGATNPPAKDALADLGNMLESVAAAKQRPPGKQADLGQYDATNPAAAAALARKEIIYLWGNGLQPGSTTVIAYQAAAEQSGGWVLLQDGTVKQMTADEFKAAPKAVGTAGKK